MAGGLHRRAVKERAGLCKSEDITRLSEALDYAAEVCFRLHKSFLEYPPRSEYDKRLAKLLYKLFNQFCPHTSEDLKGFESRQLRRLKYSEDKLVEKFRKRNETIVIHNNIQRVSYDKPIHTELAPDAGRTTKSCVASLYGCIVFTALSKLRNILPPTQVEKDYALGIYAAFSFFRPKVDKRFRRSLLEWEEILKTTVDFGYHAAEAKGYRLVSYCKKCSNPDDGIFVTMSKLNKDIDEWRCNKCGGSERRKVKFTAKNIKKREVDVINEVNRFNTYAPIFGKYIQLHSDLFRKNSTLKDLLLDEFDRCEDAAEKRTFRQLQHYFMKHYDPSKKWKIRWCSLNHDNVLRIRINDNEYRRLLCKLCYMILDDSRNFEQLQEVAIRYLDKLVKLGFREDMVFKKTKQDSISYFGRAGAEIITEKMLDVVDIQKLLTYF